MNILCITEKESPRPGIEPGPPGWKPGILTPRPSGIDFHHFFGHIWTSRGEGPHYRVETFFSEEETQTRAPRWAPNLGKW